MMYPRPELWKKERNKNSAIETHKKTFLVQTIPGKMRNPSTYLRGLKLTVGLGVYCRFSN